MQALWLERSVSSLEGRLAWIPSQQELDILDASGQFNTTVETFFGARYAKVMATDWFTALTPASTPAGRNVLRAAGILRRPDLPLP